MAINETASDVVLRVVRWDDPHAEELRAAQRADIVARYGGDFEPGHRPTAADIAVFVVETRARERGATRVRLETGTRQPEAVRLYEGAGYRLIPNFGDYVDAPASLCFERILEATE
ncbi:MAG TPA: hypothetical protein VIJ31_02820 [Acidothermaceae bacterium]